MKDGRDATKPARNGARGSGAAPADPSIESPTALPDGGAPTAGWAPAAGASPGVTFKLPRFEGPLDLLLHLIKRDEIDIHDIPIARITQQYLQYIELMRLLDLDVAGEFLVMAATLMRIKAKMLLPLPASGDEEDEGDPREELVQRLLEYRLFKEASLGMQEREGLRRDAGPLPLAPATLFDLLGALQRMMQRKPEPAVYAVETEAYDIEEKMSLIARTVAEEGRVRFSEIMRSARARMEIIVSFMALLELIRMGTVRCVQDENFADILILPGVLERVNPDASATPALGG